MIPQKSLVCFNINGIIANIEKLQEFVRIILISYIDSSEYEIPIYIINTNWKDSFQKGSPVEIRGILGSAEGIQSTPPVLIADSIFHRTESEVKGLAAKNAITGEIFLREETLLITTVHPHHATMFAGTGAIRLGPSFYGYRIHFELHLLRKNIALAKNLSKGDVVKFAGVITHKKGFGNIQIVGKEIQRIYILPNKSNPPLNTEFSNEKELA